MKTIIQDRPQDVNDSQWQAIGSSARQVLIVAGPGTGKTHTLTYRILRQTQFLKPSEFILAITFTNKAGREMRERLLYRQPDVLSWVTVGTFHQFCLKILQEFGQGTVPVDFSVPSREEIETVAQTLWPEQTSRERKQRLDKISLWKAKDYSTPSFTELEHYQAAMRAKGWLDFDDLLLEALRLLEGHPQILETVRRRYPFVFVDEFQDINSVQHHLLKMVVGSTGHLTAIGDPHQSIYGFRGADVRFFKAFAHDFPDAITLTLLENYRSSQHLLTASSQILQRSSTEIIPSLTAGIYQEGRLVIHLCPTDRAEAEFVVHTIEKLVGGTSFFSQDSGRTEVHDAGGMTFKDFAVLFRMNSQRRLLEEAFNRSGIPYKIVQEKTEEDPADLDTDAFKYDHDESQGDKVSLMTLHASKGLEFSVVFIVGCEQGLIPLNLEGLTTDLEEERRLFYVGVTRAKAYVFLTHVSKRRLYGQTLAPSPSEFLADIEEQLKEYEQTQLKPKKKDSGQMELF